MRNLPATTGPRRRPTGQPNHRAQPSRTHFLRLRQPPRPKGMDGAGHRKLGARGVGDAESHVLLILWIVGSAGIALSLLVIP